VVAKIVGVAVITIEILGQHFFLGHLSTIRDCPEDSGTLGNYA